MYDQYGLYIGGRWRPAASGATYPVIDPGTEEMLGEAPSAGPEDAEAAIAAAADGMRVWRAKNAWERGAILRRAADLMTERKDAMARAIALEVGRPLAACGGEVQLAIDQFHWYAEETKRLYGQIVESRLPGGRIGVTYEPVGIVAAFSAWNFPVVLPARKIAPALAAGCSVIVRPSEEAPGGAMILIGCLHDAGVPPGAVNLLTGKASVISPVLMGSPAVRKVSLTGSTAVGIRLLKEAADTVKRVSMELGGHAPVIVFDDVDARSVAAMAAQSKYRNTGQVCVSPSRFYIHETVKESFVDSFVEATRKLKLGHALEPDSEVGPLTTRKRLEAVEALVEDTKASGARLLAGGRRPAGFNRGYWFEPTVFDDVADDARVMVEEPFGPIAPITGFRDFDEVMDRANALEMGLASYVFTRSLKRAHEAVDALEAGMVAVNTFALATAEAPFGGIKQSGYGREGGSQGILDYMNVKYMNMVVE